MKKMRKHTRIKTGKILITDGIIILIILSMFLFVKCRHRDAFTDKGDYKLIDLQGVWYKVDLDEMYEVKFTKDNFTEKNMYGENSKQGAYEVGNHAMRLGSKEYSMKYIDESKELQNILEGDIEEYELRTYFYIIDDNGNKIYYFNKEEDAADQLDYNCQTNEYYEKTNMFDENGFAIDEEGVLLAYNGTEHEVTIPSEVTGIGENAFSADYDRALNTDKVTIPSNVKTIESGAFIFSNVKTVVIESGVKEIKDWAFGDSEIRDIYFPDTIDNMSEEMFETEEGVKNLTIHCGAGSQVE
jgi:hypothetical protein